MLRSARKKSPISAVTIRRMIVSVGKAGLPISGVELRPDGTIYLHMAPDDVGSPIDLFAKWSDRL